MTDFDEADIAAMRREDPADLRRFMRDQLRAGQARKVAPPAVKPPKPPGYQPGAWPTGARSPDPPPNRHTEADWQHALSRYRLGYGHDTDPCHCGSCTRLKEDQ